MGILSALRHFLQVGLVLIQAYEPRRSLQTLFTTTLLNQLSTAFSGGNVVHQVQLAGNATWQVGGLSDSGTATLSAASTGSAQLQLSLSASGQRIETQSGEGINLSCSWTGGDGTTHTIDPGNCWRPML